ncbi:hypothetical protein HK100_011447, partial [Physocladia obscura]
MASTFALSVIQSPPTVAKDSASDWFTILDTEEGENLACSIVDAIVQRGQEVLFEKHIESQVLPYAVQFAKDTFLKIVEWEFFKKDSGEILAETWDPDDEPQPAIIDSWARGAIPVKNSPIRCVPERKPVHILSLSSSVNALSVSSEKAPPVKPANSVARGSISATRISNSSMSSATKKAVSQTLSSQGSKVIGKGSQANRCALNHEFEETEISASVAAELSIIQENKKAVIKLQGFENENSGVKKPVEVGYDSEGRILIVKKASP